MWDQSWTNWRLRKTPVNSLDQLYSVDRPMSSSGFLFTYFKYIFNRNPITECSTPSAADRLGNMTVLGHTAQEVEVETWYTKHLTYFHHFRFTLHFYSLHLSLDANKLIHSGWNGLGFKFGSNAAPSVLTYRPAHSLSPAIGFALELKNEDGKIHCVWDCQAFSVLLLAA